MTEAREHRHARPTQYTRTHRRQTDDYAQLGPLFTAMTELPAGHPQRALLRERLIAGYLPVARHIARRYTNRNEDLQDLEQVAALGLVQAVDRFEPDRESNFLCFAVPTITGEVLRYFRDRAWMIRVPRRLKELQFAIQGATATLSQELGRAPRPSEIAALLEVSPADVADGLQANQAYRCASLDEPLGDELHSSSQDVNRFAAALGRTDPEVARFEHTHTLLPLIENLAERERTILLLRFYGDMSQPQIAERVGVSQMHVSRLLKATLAQLRVELTA
jgi:RNA polymerase sigma-B factor